MSAPAVPSARGAAPFAGARLAIAFLTVVPTGRVDGLGEAWLSRAAAWFPVVGALVGGVAAAVFVAAGAAGLSHGLAGALAIVATILFTRGLHEDGLADTADGLGVHGSRERRLAAMKDSAVGAHGALAMACALLVCALALATLDRAHAARAVVAAQVASRAAMVVAAAALPNARVGEGLGRGLVVAPVAAFSATSLGVATLVVAGDLVALAAGAAALLVAVVIQARAFGGRTGDTLGATGKVVETVVLVALSGAWSS